MHAYASVDFSGTQHYEDEVFYNNHRFKKQQASEIPSPRHQKVERYSHPRVSPPPFAYDLPVPMKEPSSPKITDIKEIGDET